MTRPTTAALDAQILALLEAGLAPKEVAARLKLKNKWRAYRARRRFASATISVGEENAMKQKVEIVKKHLKEYNSDAWLVRKGEKYYVVSGANLPPEIKAQYLRLYPKLAKSKTPYFEVLVFESDEKGNTEYVEVCGGRGITHEEAIATLERL